MGDEIDRVLEAWAALEKRGLRSLGRSLMALDGPRRGSAGAALWPLSQVLMAAIDVALLTGDFSTVDRLLHGLERYRIGDAYGPHPGQRVRYYDDNAWIALAQLYLAETAGRPGLVSDAERVFRFVASGEAPSGGVWWVEMPQASRHTCSTGPAAVLADWLGDLTSDADRRDELRGFAARCHRFLHAILRSPAGLYWDNVDNDGRVDPTLWSYNQGTPVGALVRRALALDDPLALDRARATVGAALDHYGSDDALWRQPAVFNAVFFRNLLPLALALVAELPRWTDDLDAYLERAWATARDRRTGWLIAGDIGRYEGGGTIDHAGLVQLLALRARST
jgi:predicted alpha-1,6-mannanase (GH76 family)